MRYLISTVARYRVDTEEEANALIEESKKSNMGDIAKYGCVYKNQKQKGEIVQEWWEVTIDRKINDPKDPDRHIDINYEVSF